MLADLISRVARGCRVLQESAGEPEEEGKRGVRGCGCGAGGRGRLIGGWCEACRAWPGFEATRRAKLVGMEVAVPVVMVARSEGGARPAGPGRASRRRAERSSRRGRRAGGQASRRAEVWRGVPSEARGAVGERAGRPRAARRSGGVRDHAPATGYCVDSYASALSPAACTTLESSS